MTQDAIRIALERLPHRDPFRFISRVESLGPDQSAGVWSVTGEEPFLRGHFPGNPLVPGVLIGEALAQLSGLIGADAVRSGGQLAHMDLKFLRPVRPPAEISLSSRVVRSLGEVTLYDVSAMVEGHVVARGSLSVARTVGA